MSERPLPPGVVPAQQEEALPFFKTVDFTRRPKWEVSVSFATALEQLLAGAKEDDNKDEYLAHAMENMYGKKDAMDILEHVRKHMNESIARSSYRDTTKLREFEEHAKAARGVIGTPNWKDPNKVPEPIRFSATWGPNGVKK